MALDADNLPREGLGGQHIIDSLTERVGANNTLDVIMRNLPQIARKIGAKRPDYHPGHSELNMVKNANAPVAPSQRMPVIPDTPRGLHTPAPVMMPGSQTEPGKIISMEDMELFNKRVSERKAQHFDNSCIINHNPYQKFAGNPSQLQNKSPNQISKPTYFKDPSGNEYKILGDSLYVLGWQDSTVKIRMVNSDTGKEIPSKGRKFQIYGWHLVQRVEDTNSSSLIHRFENETDVDKFEEDVKFDENAKNPPCFSEHADNEQLNLNPFGTQIVLTDGSCQKPISENTESIKNDGNLPKSTEEEKNILEPTNGGISLTEETKISDNVQNEPENESSKRKTRRLI